MADAQTKFLLTEDAIPTHWVNLLPDLPGDPLPPLHPGTMAPAGPDDLTPIFPMALILQEVSAEPEIEVPEAVREAYKLWRPTPLHRARRLEAELETQSGRANSGSPTGSLGIAISEAVEVAAQDEQANYSLGSVLNHVLLHQTVIGQETIAQMELAGDEPDVVIGCVGGGSNFAGLAYPWLRRKLRTGGSGPRFVAAEPAACPTLTKGVYAYDFGDTAGVGPVALMHTLGHNFVPDPIHAGGLRYHGDAPSLCLLVKRGFMEARAYSQ